MSRDATRTEAVGVADTREDTARAEATAGDPAGPPPGPARTARSGPMASRLDSANTRSSLLGWGAVVLVAVYPVVEVIRILTEQAHRYLYGDQALIELSARRAASLDQLVGPYSRLGFHHPGPAVFYLLAPFVAWMGSGPGVYLGSMVISGAALIAVVALMWRWVGAHAAIWSAAAIEVFCLCVRVYTLREPWNPYEVVAPMALLAVLSAGAFAGRRGALVWTAVVGSYEIQTHLSTAPAAVVLVVLPLAAVLWRQVHPAVAVDGDDLWEEGRLHVLPTVVGAVAFVAIWVAPVVELIKDRPNNLTLLWDFYTGNHFYPPLRDAVQAAGNAVAIMPFGNKDYVETLLHPRRDLEITAALLLVCWITSLALARRRRCSMPAALTGAAVVVVVMGTVGLARATGGIAAYFATWMATAPLLSLLGLAAALTGWQIGPRVVTAGERGPGGSGPPGENAAPAVPAVARRPSWVPVARLGSIGVAIGVAAAVVSVGFVVRSDLQMQSVRSVQLAPQVAAQEFATIIEQREVKGARVGLSIGTDVVWPQVAGVALELDRRSIPFTVSPASWTLEFGAQYAPGPTVATTYRFFSAADMAKLRPSGTQLASTDGVVMLSVPPTRGV